MWSKLPKKMKRVGARSTNMIKQLPYESLRSISLHNSKLQQYRKIILLELEEKSRVFLLCQLFRQILLMLQIQELYCYAVYEW